MWPWHLYKDLGRDEQDGLRKRHIYTADMSDVWELEACDAVEPLVAAFWANHAGGCKVLKNLILIIRYGCDSTHTITARCLNNRTVRSSCNSCHHIIESTDSYIRGDICHAADRDVRKPHCISLPGQHFSLALRWRCPA
jgi:hypothetical protein